MSTFRLQGRKIIPHLASIGAETKQKAVQPNQKKATSALGLLEFGGSPHHCVSSLSLPIPIELLGFAFPHTACTVFPPECFALTMFEQLTIPLRRIEMNWDQIEGKWKQS